MTAGVDRTHLAYLKEMERSRDEVNIVKVIPEKRTHAYFILDRTIFHPKGGGQPSDRGFIRSNNFEVEVKKAIYHRGVVAHWVKILNGNPATGRASCELDWPFRYMVMRNHTAAHLLDHCLATETSTRVATTDSWVGEPSYVGYRGIAPDESARQRIEDLANKMILLGANVSIAFFTPEEGKLLLQDAPNFERLPELQEVRTVTIAGCKPIPCGGTHVADISKIGKLKVLQVEKIPDGNFRLHFSVQS